MKNWSEAEDVFITHTISNIDMEVWMKEVRKMSGQEVDFYNSCGRTGIHTLGDPQKVKIALRETRKIHDNGYIKAVLEVAPEKSVITIREQLDNLWSWNNEKFNKNCS